MTEPALVVQRWQLEPQGQFHRWVVRVEARCPNTEALAIVLDLSDSCATMDHELKMVPRLLARLAHETPLWLYCLSRTTPLDTQPHRLGHLLDGSITLQDWLDNESLRKSMAIRGSLLRPVIDGIASRAEFEKMTSVVALVLTDGELFDIDPLPVPDHLKVLGLTPDSHASTPRRWSFVLPHSPLYTISDSSIDRHFVSSQFPFFGDIDLVIQCDDPVIDSWVIDLARQRRELAESGKVHTNLAESPLYVVLESPSQLLPTVLVQSIRTKDSHSIDLATIADSPRCGDVERVIQVMEQPPVPTFQIILDLREGEVGFDEAVSKFERAGQLCDHHESWIEPSGIPCMGRDGLSDARKVLSENGGDIDSLLCILLRRDTSLPERLILLGLNKSRRPAFSWKSLNIASMDPPLAGFEIAYDRREDRWQLKHGGGATEELNPGGSQRIFPASGSSEVSGCTILFSGSLKFGPIHTEQVEISMPLETADNTEVAVPGDRSTERDGSDSVVSRLLCAPVFQQQRHHVGRAAPDEGIIGRIVGTLQLHHWRMTVPALSESIGINHTRLRGFLPGLQRILNIDSQQVMHLCRNSDTVEINELLLRQEFSL